MEQGTGSGMARGSTVQPALLPEVAAARSSLRTEARRASAAAAGPSGPLPAPERPVARVLVDLPLAHLDRTFDYQVTQPQHADAVPGCRVKVRFAGQDVGGFLLERVEASDHPGRLAPLRRVVSPEPVLRPDVAALAREVAAHYAGTRADVLRLAVPPRHATVEREPPSGRVAATVHKQAGWAAGARDWWRRSPGGPAYADRLAARDRDGPAPRAVWAVTPGDDGLAGLAHAAAATLAGGRGVVLCVPDARDLRRLDGALTQVLGAGHHVTLSAELGPAKRYRAFLALARGEVRVAAGTRAAAFAPVHDLGLVAMWDDGDDAFVEPRAPYCHARQVLLLRVRRTGAALLLAGHARSVEAAALVTSGWAQDLTAPREQVRRTAPRVIVAGGDRDLARDPAARHSRLPRSAHEVVRDALAHGPVLVQTPRRGYAAALACAQCWTPARCPRCTGPLQLTSAHGPPACRWCGHAEPGRRCPECGDLRLRAPVLGERRTAEELGRAFPRVPVRRSAGDHVLDRMPDRPALVVATPGAEPVADGGYRAVVLLDTGLMSSGGDLRSREEAVRRWFAAAALARPGGRVVAVGDAADPALQALVRWDPAGFAEREAAERAAAHLPPASRVAQLTGSAAALDEVLARLGPELPAGAEVLGPVPAPRPAAGASAPDPPQQQLVVRVPRRSGAELSAALRRVQAARSLRKEAVVRVQVDPYRLG